MSIIVQPFVPLEQKLITCPLKKWLPDWRMRITKFNVVFTNGCFDILHAGHVSYLQEARQHGDYLVVGINDDRSVRKLKGAGRPINSIDDRLLVIAGLECVDYVVPIHTTTVTRAILDLAPDLWVKGGDYSMNTLNAQERAAAEKVGARIILIDAVPAKSTTRTIQAIRRLQ